MVDIRKFSKALAALLGSFATFFVSVSAPPEWAAYAGGLAALLTAVGTFAIPNKVAEISPVDQIAEAVGKLRVVSEAGKVAEKQVSAVIDQLNPVISDVGDLVERVLRKRLEDD